MKLKKLIKNKNFDVNCNFRIYDTTLGAWNCGNPSMVFASDGDKKMPKWLKRAKVAYITTTVEESTVPGNPPAGVIIIEVVPTQIV